MPTEPRAITIAVELALAEDGGARSLLAEGSMVLREFAVVGLVGLFVASMALFAAALVRRPAVRIHAPDAWKSYRFGFATYALVFLAFDMEMIFMYPWAVVYGAIGLKALLDMLVFIALLGVGVTYAWRMGALRWE